MSYTPLENLCKYYIDCIIEDNTDNISAFSSSKHITYTKLDGPEWSSRNPIALSNNELTRFRELFNYQTRGRQKKVWWYGYPISYAFVQSKKSEWQGGIIKPIFYLPIEIDRDITPILNSLFVRLNFDALKDWDIEIQEAKTVADRLGLYGEAEDLLSLERITEEFKNIYPNLSYNNTDEKTNSIHFNGVIFSAEGSPYTQGVEAELNKLKEYNRSIIEKTSLKVFFPEIKVEKKEKINVISDDFYEVFKMNDEQKKVLESVLNNDLTVVTGPPGTGKSQIVASIIINASRKGQRVLFASKNHKAVDVVEERLNQFENKPFIIRLGSKGSDDRNIKQELIQYLTTLLSSTTDIQLQHELNNVCEKVTILKKKREGILSQIEEYKKWRIRLNNLNHKFNVNVINKIGEDSANKILTFSKQNHSFIINLFSKISLQKRVTINYVRGLKIIDKFDNIENLCEKLDAVESEINQYSQKEFKLWLDTLPLRLNSQKRQKLTEYVSVLKSITEAGQDTPQKVWAKLFSNREKLMHEISGFLPAWCVSNLSAKGSLPFVDSFFDIVVIDEASQCDIPSALPLMYRAKRSVIIGDPNQLQHITGMSLGRSLTLMNNYSLSDATYSIFEYSHNSLFQCAVGRIGENNITMLREHFRSHADIISFSNQKWYNNALTVETDYSKLFLCSDNINPKVVWNDVVGKINQNQGSGAYIIEECNKVVEIAKSIINDKNFKGKIGIVTPFRLQANKIREILVNTIKKEDWSRTNLLVETTTKFQGDERDVIIFSPVVASSMPSGVKFYHETTPNLFNVSITRAKSKLIVVGNNSACLNCGITLIRDFASYVNNLCINNLNCKNQNLGFESIYEKILYEALLKNKIKTIPQYELDQYRMDLAYVENGIRIDIEVDGKEFHTDWTGEVLKKDIIRNMRLQKMGWKICRFWAYEIRDNLDYCIMKIKEYL